MKKVANQTIFFIVMTQLLCFLVFGSIDRIVQIFILFLKIINF